MKDKITKLINDYIKDEQIKQFTFHFINDNDLWWTYTMPTSSTGKYHPTVSNIKDEGIYHHTYLALLVSNTFEKFYKPQNRVTDLDLDVMRSAIILHDICKYIDKDGNKVKYSTKDHGYVASEKILDYIVDHFYDIDIVTLAKCVRYHMSNWCTVKSNSQTKYDTEHAQTKAGILERTIMICDFIASNKELIDYESNYINNILGR